MPEHEVEVMRLVHGHGFPVPRVVSVNGPDLVLERVDGPTMQEALLADGRLDHHAEVLAHLHHRLHALDAPAWLPRRAPGATLLHLDLHPRNVILSVRGPVVIDWANASAGPAILDAALAVAIFVSAKATVPPEVVVHIDAFIRSFARHFDADELHEALPGAIELRAADPNVTHEERAQLRNLRWPLSEA